MKIALIQQHATSDLEANLVRGLEHIDQAASQGAEIAVFAELAFTPFYPQYLAKDDISHLAEPVPGSTTEKFMAKAKEHHMVIIINLFELDSGKTYDASPVIDADGTLLGTTRMVHIADYECFEDDPEIFIYGCFCVLVSVGAWLFLASYLEMPVSTTHSCVGGMIGMTMVTGGPECVLWYKSTDNFPWVGGVLGIVISWFLSPIFSAIVSGTIFYSTRAVSYTHLTLPTSDLV